MLENFHIITFISSTAAMAAKFTLQGGIADIDSNANNDLKAHNISQTDTNLTSDHIEENHIFDQSCFRLIPIPPQIDASCGLCMKIEKNFEEIFKRLKQKNIRMETIYKCKKTDEGLKCTILTMQQPQ